MTQQAKSMFDQGVEHYRAGQFPEAETLLKNGLDLEPNNWQMRFYLAMTYSRQEKHRQAKQEFMSIRDLCPDAELRKRASAAFAAIGTL